MPAAAPARAPAPVRKPAPRKPARKAPARKAPARKPAARKPAARAAAPARRAVPRTQAGGHLIPLAVGRTAVAVRGLPDSGLIFRLTRGRAWIPLLGFLLAGIVALNVVTLSLTASTGKISQQIQVLDQENNILGAREAQKLSTKRVQSEAAALGLTIPATQDIGYRDASRQAVATAASRLAAIPE